jgi:hypothetical protein
MEARMRRRAPAVWVGSLCVVATILVAGAARAAKPPASLLLAAGARVGVVNLLDAEVTHFHASRELQNSFLKTYPVSWRVNALLLGAVTQTLTQLGFAPVPVAATDELRRAREACFLNAALAKGLPQQCGPPFAQLAAAQHLDAIIVLGPGRNDSAHAAGTRHRELPAYLRGWCVVSGQGPAGSAPLLLSLTELLLIGVSAQGVQLVDREWGGDGHSWTGFTPPPDLHAIPAQQLEQLQPLFDAVLKEQAGTLLTHLQAAR